MSSTHSLHPPPASTGRWALTAFGLVLALIGVALAFGGARLVTLGGSWYYLITGIALIASGLLFGLRREAGAWLYGAVFVGTVAWSLWEVGFAFWPLVPRLAPVLVLALVALLLVPALTRGRVRAPARGLAAVVALVLVGAGAAMFVPHGAIEPRSAPQQHATADTPAAADGRWQFYGRTPAGTRFAPLDQITQDNVKQLEVAWTFRTGDIAGPGSEEQNTPTQIGDAVYVCTPHSRVFALDADTGAQRWSFDPKADAKVWNRCRGVGFYEPATQPAPAGAACAQRIVLSTVDARLIQLDAKTGLPCEGFGDKGTVDLKSGLGEVKPMYYFQTSAPTVAGNAIIIGGWVFDGREIDEPSGVVRAFSADNGELLWAWDAGNPAIDKLPPAGQTYTRSTPNMWTTPAFDEKLGLIYLPTGNCPSDFFGGHKPKLCDEYNSAVVAVDLATGKERWKFATVHHDIWDYDLPAQPALYDVPDGKGGTVPALIQATKRGQIFMLDRRDGKPIAEVQERPVPQSAAAGERLSPTQPYSVGMPTIGAEPMTEARMWGATWFDQLGCRIKFRSLKYEGDFTPASVEKPTMFFPGFLGGMNWGSVSVNENNGYLVINDMRIPNIVQLVPRAEADKVKATMSHGDGMHPQAGTPYASHNTPFLSALGIPCHAPPWGTMSAIDLKTRELVWQRPLGTVQDTLTKLGVKATLPIPLGMPTLSGPITTSTGLIFYAGSQDYYLRAMDVATGKELWKGRLPVGGQGTPMTYVSPASGRQYVALAVGGARTSPDRGDYIVAYALPKKP